MRALIVAPHHQHLPNAATEAASVANAHVGSILLQGRVDERDIATAVAPGGFEMIWFCTHGNASGILLSDGMLDVDHLITYVASSGARIVVVNSCDSVHLATRIADATPADVVATLLEIPDHDAAITGALFAAQLATLKDTHEAYRRSKPANNRTYVYLVSNQPRPAAKQPRRPRTKASDNPDQPARKRGGQPGNQNASKTGFYTRAFSDLELRDLETMMTDGIDDEIINLRVRARRLMELADDSEEPTYELAGDLLDKLSRTSTTLATMLRTKKMIAPNSSNETARAIGEALTSIAKELNLC